MGIVTSNELDSILCNKLLDDSVMNKYKFSKMCTRKRNDTQIFAKYYTINLTFYLTSEII